MEVLKAARRNWSDMNARERRPALSVTAAGIPGEPGVYALYRDGVPVYIGKAKSLQSRLWGCHLRRGQSMTNSAMRRNVAQFLGIAAAADIKARRYKPTPEDAKQVSDWIREGELAWIECETEAAAVTLEDAFKREWKPLLTKI